MKQNVKYNSFGILSIGSHSFFWWENGMVIQVRFKVSLQSANRTFGESLEPKCQVEDFLAAFN